MSDNSTIISGTGGVSGYITDILGTVTSYIRKDALSDQEYTYLDAAAGTASGLSVTLEAYLEMQTYTNTGQNAWAHFAGYVLVVDTLNAFTALSGGSVASVAVTNGGSGYAAAPSVAISGDGTDATATAVISGFVASVGSITPGSGYTTVPTIGFTGGSGTGATATAAVSVLSAVFHTGDAGTGYAVSDHITLTNGVVLNVLTESGGAIETVSIVTDPSFTGTLAVTSVAQSTTTGTGSGALFDLTYGLASITVTAGGSGYTSTPTVTVSGSHSGAGTAVISGSVTGVTVTDGGTGYTYATVAFTGSNTTVATASAALSDSIILPAGTDIADALATINALSQAVVFLLKQSDFRAR